MALAGGIVALIFGAVALAIRSKVLIALLAIGGLLALVGAAWGYYDITTEEVAPLTATVGYGLYLCLIGGILGLVGGVLGLRGKWLDSALNHIFPFFFFNVGVNTFIHLFHIFDWAGGPAWIRHGPPEPGTRVRIPSGP